MNLFSHYKQRENHCTNILMNLLALNDLQLLEPFLHRLVPDANMFDYSDVHIHLFTENPPIKRVPFEFVIGIAPFLRKQLEEEIKPNPGSIPDAWITGENFTLLFEFKVSGSIDEAQFAAHSTKLSSTRREIEITWNEIGETLKGLEVKGTTKWLIEQFCEVVEKLESPRAASGMPKQVFSGRRAQPQEPYFVITGNKRIKVYTIDVILPGENPKRLLDNGTGIQDSRRWIQQFIKESSNPTNYLTIEEAVIDYCVDPDRTKQSWNRWYYGSQ